MLTGWKFILIPKEKKKTFSLISALKQLKNFEIKLTEYCLSIFLVVFMLNIWYYYSSCVWKDSQSWLFQYQVFSYFPYLLSYFLVWTWQLKKDRRQKLGHHWFQLIICFCCTNPQENSLQQHWKGKICIICRYFTKFSY